MKKEYNSKFFFLSACEKELHNVDGWVGSDGLEKKQSSSRFVWAAPEVSIPGKNKQNKTVW